MKKIMRILLLLTFVMSGWSQELHIASGGEIHISSKSYVYVGNNINVDNGGSLTVTSDATDSASLLVTGTATGDITYNRHIPTTNWHFVSAPVTTQDIGAFVLETDNGVRTNGANTFYGVSTYNNAGKPTERWEFFSTPTGAGITTQNAGTAASAGNFVSGKGYSNLRASVGKYAFKGNLATANVDITIPDNPATAENHHWAVVGNPYPAFLAGNTNANASNVLTQNIDILKSGMEALYFWDGNTDDYIAVNNSDPALYIAPGQAFIVEAKADNQTFTFPKALQEPQPGSPVTFFRTAPMTEVSLFLTKGKTIKKTRLRYLETNATSGFDKGYDAGSYRDGVPTFSIDTHLASNSTGMDFTLQCLPKTGLETTVVPLAVYAQANETIRFSAEAENLPDGLFVYLEDKVANTITKINTEDYEITLTQNLNGIGRFYLQTAQTVLSVDGVGALQNVSMYKTNNQNLRIVGLQNAENAQVKIYSLQGKEVVSKNVKALTVNDIALPKLSAGVYLVQVVSNNTKHTKKIVLE